MAIEVFVNNMAGTDVELFTAESAITSEFNKLDSFFSLKEQTKKLLLIRRMCLP